MRRLVLADTGPLYAGVDPSDIHHDRAQREIERLQRSGLGVALTYPTMLECYSLVLYELGIGTAHGWLREMLDLASLLNPSPEDYQEASKVLLSYRDQSLSMFDAVAAVVSKRLGAPVWTYDHHFDVMNVEVWREQV